jgi:type IV pilus assembly protein PilY1
VLGTTYALPEDSLSQSRIMYEGVELVTGAARHAVNFGALVFSQEGQKGGKIISEIGDLRDDEKFHNFLKVLPGSGKVGETPLLTSQTARPQAEALLDAGFYFRGKQLPVSGHGAMTSPIKYWCDQSYIILITNGLSNKDDDGALKSIVGDFDGDGKEYHPNGQLKEYGRGGSHYLDDVAKYLYETDNSSLPFHQAIKTHTVLAFQAHDPLVARTASRAHGRGSYHNVYNAQELSRALLEIINSIVQEADTSFVAPVVPTSPENRIYSGQRVYLGFFKPISESGMWHGNLKKYGIKVEGKDLVIVDKNGNPATNEYGRIEEDAVSHWNNISDGEIVELGGAGQRLLVRNDERQIYTNLPEGGSSLHDSGNRFSKANITPEDLGVSSIAERDKLVDFIYGLDAYDEDLDGDVATKREWLMGDILHSKPKVINYATYDFTNENEIDDSKNKTWIFVGSNNGMLHAFRDSDGKEMWSFIPDAVLPNLKKLNTPGKSYFVDGTPVAYIYDHDGDGKIGPLGGGTDNGVNDLVMLVFGLRRGGDAYYALDVTDPRYPKLLWKVDSSTPGFQELGQTWSEPQIGKVKDAHGDRIVAFVGAGYDKNEDARYGETMCFPSSFSEGLGEENVTSSGDTLTRTSPAPNGRGVYALTLATIHNVSGIPSPIQVDEQVLHWQFTYDADHQVKKRLHYSFPSDVTVFDSNFDGYSDRLYVGDTGGRMWRFDLHGNNPLNWTGKIIAYTGTCEGSSEPICNSGGRKIFYRPSITVENEYTMVAFGTGDRAHPLNTAVTDRLYMIKDKGQGLDDCIDESVLYDATLNTLQESSTTAESIDEVLSQLSDPDNYGWFIDLDEGDTETAPAGEKVLAPALIFNKVIYYTTYSPAEGNDDPCGSLGISRLYAVDYKTGEAVLNFDKSNDGVSTKDNSRAISPDGSILMRSDRSKYLVWASLRVW